MKQEPDSAVYRSDLIKKIAKSLRSMAKLDGWESISVNQSALTGRVHTEVFIFVSGESMGVRPIPSNVVYLLNKIRTRSYTQDKGTWFMAKISIDSEGIIETSFDSSTKPTWPPNWVVTPDDYKVDLVVFPRALEAIPNWLIEEVEKKSQIEVKLPKGR